MHRQPPGIRRARERTPQVQAVALLRGECHAFVVLRIAEEVDTADDGPDPEIVGQTAGVTAWSQDETLALFCMRFLLQSVPAATPSPAFNRDTDVKFGVLLTMALLASLHHRRRPGLHCSTARFRTASRLQARAAPAPRAPRLQGATTHAVASWRLGRRLHTSSSPTPVQSHRAQSVPYVAPECIRCRNGTADLARGHAARRLFCCGVHHLLSGRSDPPRAASVLTANCTGIPRLSASCASPIAASPLGAAFGTCKHCRLILSAGRGRSHSNRSGAKHRKPLTRRDGRWGSRSPLARILVVSRLLVDVASLRR